MKSLILKAVGVREEAVEAARQEEREKITAALEAAILQEREAQSMAWNIHLQNEGQRANEMVQLHVSRVHALEEALRKSEAEVLLAQGNIQGLKAIQVKRKAEEKKREAQESKKEEGERKLRDCKMSEVVVLLDVAPALERDTDVEMEGVEPLIIGQSPPPNSPKKIRGMK
ncbi:hypothetical protein DFH27DRAFT_639684 [Peziza echinospora]|nr:hypothetical protein DFH27DRAFT_639684 [Peziza echinospora]